MTVVRRATTKLQAPALTEADVEAVSAALNEPQWVLESRLASWELYESMPMPSLKAEEWRRTDYTKINWEEGSKLTFNMDSRAGLDVIPQQHRSPLIGDRQGGLIAAVDGRTVHSELSDELKQQGVIFCDLSTAVRDHEAIVRPLLMTKAVKPSDGKFAALQAALWTQGTFLYVPKNVKVTLPLHSVFYNTQSGMTLGHILVVLEEGAEAIYLHEYLSDESVTLQAAYVGATEILVSDNADLKYVSLQDWGRNVYDFRHERGRVAAHGKLDWVLGTMGSKLTKDFTEIELDGEFSWGRMSALYFADTDQLFDHDTQQNHNAPHTTSDLLFKGALKDESKTVWQGMIKVLPNAQKTDGFQANRNLVLSKEARADSIPGLEIEANDVRCTHAATVGKLEDEPIFYLMSRGMTRADAERLIVVGYFDPIMDRIPFDEVKRRLQEHIQQKLEARVEMFA
ncbi:MAG: Fe-S cluster assembly protein SufD [Anaerolineae bacterium]|nr:Fe-S cluster assembly protein SufD [Anaerolineae bacterium]